MRTPLMTAKVLFSTFFFVLTGWITVGAGDWIPGKIVLGRFEVAGDGKIVRERNDPDWRNINRHNLAVDDFGRIYVLNLRAAKILVFNAKGRVLREIPLPVKGYDPVFSGEGSSFSKDGYLMVSGRGETFLVETPPTGGSPGDPVFRSKRQFILSQNGLVIKEYKGDGVLSEFPEVRKCDHTYRTEHSGYVFDENFRKTEKIESSLNMGETILSRLPPDPFPFLTDEEKNKREPNASGEIFSSPKVACNGDVYLVYQLGELPSEAFKRWLANGEYFIYKYETKDKGRHK